VYARLPVFRHTATELPEVKRKNTFSLYRICACSMNEFNCRIDKITFELILRSVSRKCVSWLWPRDTLRVYLLYICYRRIKR